MNKIPEDNGWLFSLKGNDVLSFDCDVVVFLEWASPSLFKFEQGRSLRVWYKNKDVHPTNTQSIIKPFETRPYPLSIASEEYVEIAGWLLSFCPLNLCIKLLLSFKWQWLTSELEYVSTVKRLQLGFGNFICNQIWINN